MANPSAATVTMVPMITDVSTVRPALSDVIADYTRIPLYKVTWIAGVGLRRTGGRRAKRSATGLRRDHAAAPCSARRLQGIRRRHERCYRVGDGIGRSPGQVMTAARD
jgi:hypothetical protein